MSLKPKKSCQVINAFFLAEKQSKEASFALEIFEYAASVLDCRLESTSMYSAVFHGGNVS